MDGAHSAASSAMTEPHFKFRENGNRPLRALPALQRRVTLAAQIYGSRT